nr:uncharacterized protein K02A2.6-like [Drosophila bipectinata]
MSISEKAEKSILDEEIADAITCLQDDSWTSAASNNLYPFRFELSTIGNILLRGNRLIIPTSLQEKVLELAHEGHPGESAMKRRLRSKVWWPGIDRAAEKFVKSFRDYLLVSQANTPAPMSRTPFPTGPWICVASDLLGPLPNGEFVLVFIDYYSRYLEFKFLRSITSTTIIDVIKEILCRLGFPKYLRTDNGRQYISSEFKEYCKVCGIEQIRTPPYWPQANEYDVIERKENIAVVSSDGDSTRRLDKHRTNGTPASTDSWDEATKLGPRSEIKADIKGGMWEPAAKSESDSGSNDVSADVNG